MRATQSRAKLRDMLGAEIVAEKHTSVPRQFVDDFEAVAKHYKLRECGEYDQARNAARADLDNAIICFASLAREIE
jgi:hypothetical protein